MYFWLIHHKQVLSPFLLPPNEKWALFLKPIRNRSYHSRDSFPNKYEKSPNKENEISQLIIFLVWNVVSELLPIKYLKAERKKYSHGRLHEYKLNFVG